MIQVGDRVIYGTHGVCDVSQTEEKIIDNKNVTYLVLEPLGQTGSRYLVPTHNEIAMGKLKKMMTREELEDLFQTQAMQEGSWISDEAHRKQVYRELICSGDRQCLMAMMKGLYRHRKEQSAAGRKIHLCDDNFLRDAEKLLAGEVSVVMAMEPEQARQYIRAQLQD